MARNAHTPRTTCLGTSAAARRVLVPRRLPVLLALVAVAAAPVPARAADPLLSGYAGPGSGEQVILGGQTVGGGVVVAAARAAAPRPAPDRPSASACARRP